MTKSAAMPKVGFPFGGRKNNIQSKKVATIFCLCTLSVLSIAILDEVARSTQRRLNCVPNRSLQQEGMEETRNLSKIGIMIDRVLDLVADEPCTTSYPEEADQLSGEMMMAASNEEPSFDITSDNYFQDIDIADIDNTFILSPQSSGAAINLDFSERNLITSFTPEVYDPVIAEERASNNDKNSVAYILPLAGCPGVYEPGVDATFEPTLSSDLYEATAVVKCAVCETTEAAATARRLGETRKLVELGDRLSAAEMNYTMHAIIHPEATSCPVQGTTGEEYDRVKLLQSLNFKVEILGQPITVSALSQAGQDHLNDNIENDVGIRDSIKLRAWTMTDHPVVVLMNYNTLLDQAIDQEIDLLLASDTMKGLYIHTKADPDTGGAGVDTGFMIIKPNQDEFDNIVETFLATPYDPTTGWNDQGYNNFKGGLGISGFLAYYFANNPGYVALDRCTYAHTADSDCLGSFPFANRKASSMRTDVCGDPRNCPYSHPTWSASKTEACETMHRTYYNYRYKFEEKFLLKQAKQPRIGLFKQKAFLGYCKGPGKNNFLSLTGTVVQQPAWQTICPPDKCPSGTYMKPDCTCTDPLTPCTACPENTMCQTYPSLMCIDCACAFCDSGSTACCEFDGVNNCRAGSGDSHECDREFNYFPAFKGTENVCGDVELSRNEVPNGCGCKPDAHHPCTYSDEWGTPDSKCFICTASDFAAGDCETCKDCLMGCLNSSCMGTSTTKDDFMTCMDGITDRLCRAQCHYSCMKS